MRKTFGVSLILLGMAGMSQLFGDTCFTSIPVIHNLAFLQVNTCGVPEINPGTAASALALLSGGLLLLRRRVKK